MKKPNNIAIIKSVSCGANEYVVNGVTYTVESRFVPYDIKNKQATFHDKIKRIIRSDFIPLTVNTDEDILETNNVCLTAGKEDCRLSRNTADRKRMGILPSRHKTGSCG